jgi:hypothetical protein
MRDLQLNLRSFHQTKTLCLLALIFNHCLSFSAQQSAQSLSSLSFAPGFLLLALLNGLFVTMTGVTYRITLDDQIQGHRLRGGLQSAVDLLLILIGIDFLKNLWVYDGRSPLLEWDFLKTILVSFLICYILSRIHIYLCFLFAGLVSWFYLDIRNFLFRFAWIPTRDWQPPAGFSAYHYANGGVVTLLALYLTFKIWRPALPIRLKVLLSAGLAWLWLMILDSLAQASPAFFEIQLGHDWWLDGLVGGPGYRTLMPTLVWGLGLPAGFAFAHFFKRHPEIVEKLNAAWVMAAAACVFIPLWWFMNYTTPLLQSGATNLWALAGENETSFWVEVMHAAALILVFSAFYLFNRYKKIEWFDDLCVKFSVASFWIYLLATSVPPLLIEKVHGLTDSLWTTTMTAFYVTMALSWVLAEALFLLSQKQLRLTLARAEEAG